VFDLGKLPKATGWQLCSPETIALGEPVTYWQPLVIQGYSWRVKARRMDERTKTHQHERNERRRTNFGY
jgi:hypothetical protein